MAEEGLSTRPSDAIEPGIVPVDCNMEVKDAEFTIWDYQGKGQQTVAAKLTLVDDEGAEYEQYYSVGPPDKFVPSGDGKMVLPATDTVKGISTTCNYMDFQNGLISAGFPENKLGTDISVIVGLYAHWIGKPQRERKGIPGGTMPLPVPDKVLRLPGEKGGKTAAAPKTAAPAAEASADVIGALVELAKEVVEEQGGTTTFKKLAAEIYSRRADDPNKDAMLEAVFGDELKVELMSGGLTVKGSDISA